MYTCHQNGIQIENMGSFVGNPAEMRTHGIFQGAARSWRIDGSDAQMTENKPNSMPLTGRYTAVGVLMGLLVGALEGVYRYRHPAPPVLIRPDVSYVILFLGPLVDGLAVGFLGLLAGLFVASRGSRIWRGGSVIVGICLAAMLVLANAINLRVFAVNPLMGKSPIHFILAKGPWIVLVGASAFIAGRLLPLKTLRLLLAMVLAVSLLGVGAYTIRPSLRRADVAPKPAGQIREPNIILITLDTVRADHVSLYGYSRPTTPRIDKWGRRGVVFENAIAASPWTLPSHASMFTGLLPHQHGADFAEPLDPSWWTLAEVLSSRGYETAGFTSNLVYGWMGWGMGNGFEFYDDDSTSLRHNLVSLLLVSLFLPPFYQEYVQPDDLERRDAGQINRDVLRWFHHRSPRPFYLFINYYDVHAPYLVPAHHASRFGRVSPWRVKRIESAMGEAKSHPHLTAEDQDSLMTSYDNCLAFLDDSVNELLESLSCLPGWENTIVIITSDHGEGFGEHGTYNHGSNLYREVLRVPLIIWGPNIPAGLRIPHLVRLQEIFETILQFAGMNNTPFQRASLQRFWRPGFEPGDFDEFAVSEFLKEGTFPASTSLTTPEWQYIRYAQGSEELFRWVSDPAEKFNLAQSPENQERLKNLQIQLRAAVAESLRPWRRPEYLSAFGGSGGAMANADRLSAQFDSSSAHPPGIPIGTSQAFFPRRAFTSTQRPAARDEELLRSLPYH